MKGDYSRKTFDPRDNYAGVRMQQGRVQLDADWNEQADIRDRRDRAMTVDLHGRCVCSEQTPDAFLLANDSGALTIAPGRAYVDGLLADNHGNAPFVFDEILSEQRGTTPVPYLSQPYLPSAPELLPEEAGTVLVYLDVWYRHVTYLEDEDIVEKAVGVDTTTRQQAVWQVRLLEDVGNIDCETADADIPGWIDMITPSGGRLSWEAVGTGEPDDPCRIPPSAGYRALENRLYRVEIHDGGDPQPGPATFKWSRYNGTVASRVTAIPELDQLIVDSTGRDDVLRFNAGDWVEITDDHLELEGLPGQMRRIDTVDDGTRTITLRDDLDGGVFPTDAQGLTTPGRHTRVRRWDQSGVVRDTDDNLLEDLNDALSPGVIPVPADGTSIVLEDGVQITFGSDPAGAPVRTGDYWCFAARAGQPELDDERSDQPPHGIHHHYCRLGIAEFDGDDFVGDPSDCRHPPEIELGESCCTVVVQPGDSIQAAIDALPVTGGCVCIKTGLHIIEDVLRIGGPDITVHGETTGARIRREDGGSEIFRVASPTGAPLERVSIERLQMECIGQTDDVQPIVDANRTRTFTLRDCVLAADNFGFIIAVRIAGTFGVQIERNVISNVVYGIFVDTDSTDLDICDNTIVTQSLNGGDSGIHGIWLEDAFGASRVVNNTIENFVSGISLNRSSFDEVPTSGAGGTLIAGNEIVRDESGGDPGVQRIYGIDVAAWSCTVSDNVLSYRSPAYGGIRYSAPNGCVENNRLFAARIGDDDVDVDPAIGIQLGFVSADGQTRGAHGTVVRANRLFGPQDAIVVLETNDVYVLDNVIDENFGEVRNAIILSNSTDGRVSGNRILEADAGITLTGGEGNRVSGNEIRGGRSGLAAGDEMNLETEHNQIENLRGIGMLTNNILGTLTFKDNAIESCGYAGVALGIGVGNAFGDVTIESCTVTNTGVSPDGSQVVQPAIGIAGLIVLQARIQNNLVTYSNLGTDRNPNAEDRALAMLGSLEFVANDIVFGFPIQILDNNFAGPGFSHLVELFEFDVSDNVAIRFSRVQFNNNHLTHMTPAVSDLAEATVSLVGRSAIVMGNFFTAFGFRPSVDFNGMRAIYMGNDHVSGPVNFTAFPTPGNNFNR